MKILRIIRYLPRNVVILLLRVYRTVISPLYGDVCRYYPSCSSYALQSVQQYGVFLGVWRGIRRIARCHPWAKGGFDNVLARERTYLTNRFGFVVDVTRKVSTPACPI